MSKRVFKTELDAVNNSLQSQVNNSISKTIVDAKGDIVTASAADTPIRLAVGTNEHRLVADSATTSGLKYVADTTNYAVGAKGDLLAGTAADTVSALTVGANGETLVADSSTSTGLRWGNNYGFTAGKNLLINGDLRINQRAFTSTTVSGTYTFDRFCTINGGGTVTYSAQTFTAGAAPVAGYEAINYLRIVTASQGVGDYAAIFQAVEDVRTMAGKTFTVSFWAKANTGTPKMFVIGRQKFGSGGSGDVDGTSSQLNISTTWQRYSFTVSMPSISGKTIGTGSYTQVLFLVSDGNGSMGAQNNTFELWGFQVEQGSVATAFQTATGTLAGELAACQRYYQKSYNQGTAPATNTTDGLVGTWATAVDRMLGIRYPVVMRVAPTVTIYSSNGTSGKVTTFAGVDAGGSVIGDLIGDAGYRSLYTGTNVTASTPYSYHYTLSSEL